MGRRVSASSRSIRSERSCYPTVAVHGNPSRRWALALGVRVYTPSTYIFNAG